MVKKKRFSFAAGMLACAILFGGGTGIVFSQGTGAETFQNAKCGTQRCAPGDVAKDNHGNAAGCKVKARGCDGDGCEICDGSFSNGAYYCHLNQGTDPCIADSHHPKATCGLNIDGNCTYHAAAGANPAYCGCSSKGQPAIPNSDCGFSGCEQG